MNDGCSPMESSYELATSPLLSGEDAVDGFTSISRALASRSRIIWNNIAPRRRTRQKRKCLLVDPTTSYASRRIAGDDFWCAQQNTAPLACALSTESCGKPM